MGYRINGKDFTFFWRSISKLVLLLFSIIYLLMSNIFPRIRSCAIIALLGCIFISGFAQDNTIRHKVKAGETIYSISTKYGLTAKDITKANPGLDPNSLKAGAFITIPSKDYFKEGNCREMHKVKRKETLWGIAHDYGITVDELVKANPEISSSDFKLKKGTFVCIPYPKDSADTIKVAPKAISHPLPKLSISLILPLKGKGIEVERSVEFTRGFLMAVKAMKEDGKDIDIYIHNETPNASGLSEFLSLSAKNGVQLLVGPLYPNNFGTLARWARDNGMKCLIPFSSKAVEVENIPNVYLLNAPENYKATFAASLFIGTFKNTTKAIFIQTENGNERAFQKNMRTLLVDKGYDTATLTEGFTEAQLKSELSNTGTTVIIPDASTKDGAIAATEIVANQRIANPGKPIALIGYPEWQETAKSIRTKLHAADTYIISNFFYNPYSNLTKAFENEYKVWFGTPMLDFYPRMAILGYDAGINFMSGLSAYGMEFTTQKVEKIPYQSDMHFVKAEKNGGYINDCIQFIHYRSNNVIEKISPR